MLRLLVLSVLLAPVPAAAAAAIGKAAWLAGCWARTGAEPGSGEQWTSAAGGTLLGVGRSVRDGRTVEHEYLLIREAPEGRLEYLADPSGQAPTRFLQADGESDGELLFENPAHDFPQRIRYRRDGESGLVAAIEGERDGQPRRIEFPMQRKACPL